MKSSLTILGAGASGLLSALVLSPHYEEILLIDRYWPDELGLSQGTPQSHHLHVLLAEGQRLLSSLLPDVWSQLTDNSLPVVDWGKDTWWKTPHGILTPNDCDVKTHLFSRHYLNQVLWSQCQQRKNIKTLTATVAQWLIEKRKIKQVQFKERESLAITGHVIDARGRASGLQKQLGLESLQVNNQYRYFSTRLEQSDWLTDLKAKQVYIQACPKRQPIGFVLSPIEGNALILTLIDTTGTIKTDEQKQSAVSYLFEKNQLGHIHCQGKSWIPYANLNNKRLIIERQRWPLNLWAVGDSIGYQNPVYGQGLTVILKQVVLLKRRGRVNWLKQKKLHRCSWIPWLLASNQDMFRDKNNVFQWLMQKLLRQASHEPSVGKTFIQLLHQIKSPWILSNPRLILKLTRRGDYD
ncbi:hypothetical protein LEAN103870_08005 [Legionella anisa]|uniref:FAD-binding domain-containing protein n=1 Tax=Legionella anisa TaxID=28082 RepID=A0AAX0WPU2_9GAMM|nr:hypothetical protein [Legionella anisa]AWN73227.1 hypothetical protein DLD14_04875 [Legionella anisa]KTC69504.1 putative epoxidase LasC [Legionella anisa]MCW8424067.1 hypothetical protein [Legionella anisa]MCW8447590.1 hypothetical protein [Legionella anisa]PNL60344.1 hypothetical protein A6J39_003465 [Legionella anisa]